MTTNDLDADHAESLLRLIEASPKVMRRHQFYLWTQGDMQRLVPHKLSACGAYDMGQRALTFHVLNSVPLQAELLSALGDTQSAVMTYLQNAWGKSRSPTCWIDLRGLAPRDPMAHGLAEQGYRWLLVSGVTRPSRPLELESFFVFGSPGGLPDDQSAHCVAMLLPYLHMTFVRMHDTEREMGGMGMVRAAIPFSNGSDRARAAMAITDREREILCWVREGKSNQAISEELGISALTVKNHVQKILRKLGAANRAQAVARAMALNLFNAATESASLRAASELPSTGT